jgi:hypothetical protein
VGVHEAPGDRLVERLVQEPEGHRLLPSQAAAGALLQLLVAPVELAHHLALVDL